MPHITVELFPGKSREEKLKIAEKVRAALCEETGHRLGAVSVSVTDVPKEQWKERVYDKVVSEDDTVIMPDYKM